MNGRYASFTFVDRITVTEPGVAAPEVVGAREDCFEYVLKHLDARGVHVFHHLEEL